MQWLKRDFLGYLDQWEMSVQARGDGFKAGQKNMMLLSGDHRYMHGACIIAINAVDAFVGLVEYVFTLPDVSKQQALPGPHRNFFWPTKTTREST